MTSVSQPTARPTKKVTAATIAGTVTGAVLWFMSVVPDPDVEVPGPLASLVTLGVSVGAAYLVRDRVIVMEP